MTPLLYILLLLLFLHAPLSCSAVANDTLVAGQALAVGDKLISRNVKFALGFFQPSATISGNISLKSPNWYLGIWFNKISVFTTVWIANRNEPITHPNLNLTHLKISSDGNLAIILDHAGTESTTIWSTHIIANRTQTTINTTSVVLLNNGNLVVIESPSSDILLWQSFDCPTDVGLPGSKLGRNKVTGLIRRGISKMSLIDPGLGSYSTELGTSGHVLQHRNPLLVYWSWPSTTTLNLQVLKWIMKMDPRTKGLVVPSYVDNNEEQYYMYTLTDNTSYVILLLDISGQMKLNLWSQAEQSWQTIYAQPADPCSPLATCGPFTVCNGNAHPPCDCMESFSLKSLHDWELDDRTGGCIRDTPLVCTGNGSMTSSTDMFRPIAQVKLPYAPQSMDSATTQSKCEEACLGSCSCTAYSYSNSKCSIWHGELLSANLNDGTDNTSEDVLYLRLAAKDLPSLKNNNRKPNMGFVIVASIISFGLILILVLVMFWRNKFKWCGLSSYDNQGSGGIIVFRYTDLVEATKNFSEKLGAGGFGSVYKGVLSNSTTIAVKRLDGTCQGEKQFRAEVSSIGLIQHVNQVKLIGFCCQGDNRLLAYEHMFNGSLDAHLFKSNTSILNWATRYQIALGIARGLSYLHQSCRECIIHCDIKPENILLDTSFFPKIADFGMATFVGRNFSRVLTTFRGTIGYLAPEWLSGVRITPKVDVYSFGMVLLEIISGRRNSPGPVLAIDKLYIGDIQSLVDPQLHGDFNLEQVERACKVACWCIQDNEFDRPMMGEVVRVLEGLQEINMPPMPKLLAAITEYSNATSNVIIHKKYQGSYWLGQSEREFLFFERKERDLWVVDCTVIIVNEDELR